MTSVNWRFWKRRKESGPSHKSALDRMDPETRAAVEATIEENREALQELAKL